MYILRELMFGWPDLLLVIRAFYTYYKDCLGRIGERAWERGEGHAKNTVRARQGSAVLCL